MIGIGYGVDVDELLSNFVVTLSFYVKTSFERVSSKDAVYTSLGLPVANATETASRTRNFAFIWSSSRCLYCPALEERAVI